MISEIAGSQASGKNLSTKIHALDQESLRQQELIYNAEFQVQQLERKVARASGERTGDEKKELHAKIAQRQAELEEVKAQRSMLQTQVRKLGDELRIEQRACDACKKEKVKLDEVGAELELENKSAAAELNQHAKRKEEAMVASDVMKLEVRRLRDALSKKADEVFSLENRKFQLQLSMEERRKEIAVHREVQRAQARAADEERHKSTTELAERTMRVDKLRSKYEAVAKGSGADPEGDGGDAAGSSQAFFVIQAAQKKEELQREGDELDAKIRKCEREIRALENTLKTLTVRNTAYRESFQKADPNSAGARELSDLEEQMKDAQDVLFKRKKEMQRLQTDFEEDGRRMKQVREQAAHILEHNEHLQSAHSQVTAEIDDQKLQLINAERQASELSAQHRSVARSHADADAETLMEVSFKQQADDETADAVLFTLDQLRGEFPEVSDRLQQLLDKGGLQVPLQPPARIARTAGGETA